MKLSRFAIAAAVAGLLWGTNAQAQQSGGRTVARAASTGFVDGQIPARDISYGPKDAPEPASPSDQPMAPAADKEEEEEEPTYKLHRGLFGRCLCCEEAEEEEVPDVCFRCKWFQCCGPEHKPTRFFHRNECQRNLIDGYINPGYVWNPYRPRDKFNGPYNWMDRANELNLQEIWLNVHRDIKIEDGCGSDWGYQFTTVYGTNSRFITAAGFEDRINKGSPFYGLAFPNANIQYGHNDLKLTLGRFVSPVGYYTVGQGNNFFSHIPYTYQYGEVFTQTGLMAQYQMTDDMNVGGGFSHGWDNFDHTWNKSTGPFWIVTKNHLLKCGDSLAVFGTYSQEPSLGPAGGAVRYGIPVSAFTPRYLQSIVYSRPITDKLSYVAQSDLGAQSNPFGPGSRTAYWYGLNQYAYYKVNNCWSYGLNAEWFRDDGGFRVGGFLPNVPNNNNGGPTATRGLGIGRSGFDGSFYRMAAGVNYKPHPNILSRTSLVWDWYSGPANAAGPDANGVPQSLPFLNGSNASRTQVLVASDVVIFF